MLTYGELQSNVASIVQRTTAAYKTKIGVWLNIGQTFLYNIYDYYSELQGLYPFDTVDGTEDYFMPNDFDKPFRIYNQTNPTKVTIKTEEVYEDANIVNVRDATEGVPTQGRIYGTRGIKASIAAAGSIMKTVSSSASDKTQTIRYEGYIDSDKTILDFEDVSLNGTTTVSGTKTFYDITRQSKSADTTGYITTKDASGNTLSILTSIDRVLYHKVLKLGLIPDDTYEMRMLYKKKIRRLVNDNDYAFIDADDFLIMEAVGYAYAQEKESVDRANLAWSKSGTLLTQLLTNVQGQLGPSYQHKIISTITQAHRIR